MTRPMWISLAGLVLAATLFGLVMGLRAIPPGETQIIEAAAVDYVAETGGAATDCFARPSVLEGVRLVVICVGDGGGSWVRAVDTYGAIVEIGSDMLVEEPVT